MQEVWSKSRFHYAARISIGLQKAKQSLRRHLRIVQYISISVCALHSFSQFNRDFIFQSHNYSHGRTETIRPCSEATKQLCDVILSKNRPSNSELRAQIDQCSKVHAQLTKEAAMGQGFDRHLYGLRHMAKINGIADDAYKVINHNIMSTSTFASFTCTNFAWSGVY